MKQIILGTKLFGSEFTKKASNFLIFPESIFFIIAERYPFLESNKLFGETVKKKLESGQNLKKDKKLN